VVLANGARVQQKAVTNARAGEYVNLSEFLPCIEPSNTLESVYDECTGTVHFKSNSNSRKKIDSFLTWSQAWAGYESLLIHDTPSRYTDLMHYRLFVQKAEATHRWEAVYNYDQRHRVNLSEIRSLEFNTVNTELYLTLLNSQTIRSGGKACFKCRSLEHISADCPFQEGATVGKAHAQGGGKYTGVVTCNKFNQGICNDDSCPRLHACRNCQGPDPTPRCKTCSSQQRSSNGSSFTASSGAMGTTYGTPSR